MADRLSLAPELQDEAALGANVTPEASWHTDDSLSDSTVSPQLQPARRAGDQANLHLPATHKQALQQARAARIVRFQDLADAQHSNSRCGLHCCMCSCCACSVADSWCHGMGFIHLELLCATATCCSLLWRSAVPSCPACMCACSCHVLHLAGLPKRVQAVPLTRPS